MKSKEKQVKERIPETADALINETYGEALLLGRKKIKEGTASSQLICQFIKLGQEQELKDMAQRERAIKLETMEAERDLIVSKKKQIDSQRDTEAAYVAALEAMKLYSGSVSREDDDDDEEL